MQEVELLKEKGLKVTPQRVAIIELLEQYGHLSIQELYELIKKRFSTISLATIYKNLNSMLNNDLINEIKLKGQDNKYEIAKNLHSHLVCKECGKIEDIFLQTDKILKEFQQNEKFLAQEINVNIYGICQKCLNNIEKET